MYDKEELKKVITDKLKESLNSNFDFGKWLDNYEVLLDDNFQLKIDMCYPLDMIDIIYQYLTEIINSGDIKLSKSDVYLKLMYLVDFVEKNRNFLENVYVKDKLDDIETEKMYNEIIEDLKNVKEEHEI